MQNIINVIQDAILDNNTSTIISLGSELATLLKADRVAVDDYGIFAEFKFEDKLFKNLFKLRYIRNENPFWIAEFLTTQKFYKLVIGENPSIYLEIDSVLHPVENVNFDNAISFCEKLNLYFKIPGMKFDLPTANEWDGVKPLEYEGIDLKKHEDLKKVAWFYKNSNNSTQPVGKKQCNINGLYDLLGNVWEWTKTDFIFVEGSETERRKLVKGGAYNSPAWYLRRGHHLRILPRNKNLHVGFRVVLRSS